VDIFIVQRMKKDIMPFRLKEGLQSHSKGNIRITLIYMISKYGYFHKLRIVSSFRIPDIYAKIRYIKEKGCIFPAQKIICNFASNQILILKAC